MVDGSTEIHTDSGVAITGFKGADPVAIEGIVDDAEFYTNSLVEGRAAYDDE